MTVNYQDTPEAIPAAMENKGVVPLRKYAVDQKLATLHVLAESTDEQVLELIANSLKVESAVKDRDKLAEAGLFPLPAWIAKFRGEVFVTEWTTAATI